MKKRYVLFALLLAGLSAYAQNTGKSKNTTTLSEREIMAQAKLMGIPASDMKGYLEYRKSQLQKQNNTQLKIQELDPNAPLCYNAGFESAGFSGWTGRTGSNINGTAYYTRQFLESGHHAITSPGSDPAVGTSLPTVCPWGGSHSVKLGNGTAGAEAEQLERTFYITSSNRYFTYSYAVVTETSDHTGNGHPFFVAEFIDSKGAQVPCSVDSVLPDSPGMTAVGNTFTVYKGWTSRTVDLTNYIDQYVTLRFTTADCSLGGHYTYAYIDGSCIDTEQKLVMCGGPVTLAAPGGARSYHWSTGSNAPSIQVSTPGDYSVTISNGCAVTMNYHVSKGAAPMASFISATGGSTVEYTNTTIAAVSCSWDFGDGSTSNTISPAHNYPGPGTYTTCLTVADSSGCSTSTCQVVNITTANNTLGIQTASLNEAVGIYPNPSPSGFITLNFERYSGTRVKIMVYDILGNSVYEREIISNNLESQLVDLTKQPTGNYFINITAGEESFVKRIAIK
jgi:PKD repeat protein